MQKPKIIALVGPTSSGKSAMAVFVAQKIGGEVISADSRQVYKGLDIGTGKVTKKEMVGIPHHLLSLASPKRIFTASDFAKRGERTIQKILRNGHVPIVAGGTGLYADVLLGRIVVPEVSPNPALRAKLEGKSAAQLFALLKKKDPARAASIEPKHKRRLIRALEIAAALGKNPPKQAAFNPAESAYDVLWLGLNPSEATLHKNIRTRLKARLGRGMLAEAKRLHAGGLSYKRMEALGLEYRYMALYLQNKLSKEAMEQQLERAIQKYAKRQMRWFKRNNEIHWLKNKAEGLQLTKKFLGGR